MFGRRLSSRTGRFTVRLQSLNNKSIPYRGFSSNQAPDWWTHSGNVASTVWNKTNEEISGRIVDKRIVSYVKTAYVLPIIIGRHYVSAVSPLCSIITILLAASPITSYWTSLTLAITCPIWLPMGAWLVLFT